MNQDSNTFSNSIYSGVFDLANGNNYDKKYISNFLKFAALFFNNIIIVDSWFTTPNPLTTYLKQILETKNKSVYNNDIVLLLESGFIKPALRLGDSMYDNWIGNKYGIGVNKFAGFGMSDGKRILEFVEEHLPEQNKYIMWPENMGKANNTDFSRLINNCLINESSNLTLKESLIDFKDSTLTSSEDRKIIESAENLRLKFIELAESNLENPKFRRGDIEDLVKKHFKADENKNIYQYIIDNKYKNLNYNLAHYMLNSVSTVYEIYHSYQFSTVGGLLPYNNDKLIEEGIYKQISNTVELSGELDFKKKNVLVQGSLDLSRISIESILNFRKKEEEIFFNYNNRLIELHKSKNLNEFEEKRNDLINFIAKDFLPTFYKLNPSAGMIKSISNVVANATFLGGGGALIAYEYFANGSLITIANNPFLYLISGISGIIKAIPPMLSLKESIKNFLSIHNFEKNNYSLIGN